MPNLEQVKAARRILIVTEKLPDFASLLCSLALISIFTRAEKQVNWYLNSSNLPPVYQSWIANVIPLLIKSLDSKAFGLIIGEESEIETAEIQKKGRDFEVIINTKEGKLSNQSLELKPLSLDFDGIVQITPSKYSLIKEDKILNDFLKTQHQKKVYFDTSMGLGETLVKAILENQFSLEVEEATILIAAILWETQDTKQLQTLGILNRLIFKYKGDYTRAQQIIEVIEKGNAKIWGRNVLKNIKQEEKIFRAVWEEKQLGFEDIFLLTNAHKLVIDRNIARNTFLIADFKVERLVIANGKVITQVEKHIEQLLSSSSDLICFCTKASINTLLNKQELDTQLSKPQIAQPLLQQVNKEKQTKFGLHIPGQGDKDKSVDKMDKQLKVEKGNNSENKKTKESNSEIKQKNKENRNTSILNKQQPKSISIVNSSKSPASQSFDPLPPANW